MSANELAVYTRDVETAQRAYDSALQRSTVSKIESRASQTNVALYRQALFAHTSVLDGFKPNGLQITA